MSSVQSLRFCARQGWTHPQLLFILPPERTSVELTPVKLSAREHITLPSTTQLSANYVLSWLQDRLLSRVEEVEDVKQLEQVWLNTTHVQEKKVLLHVLRFQSFRLFARLCIIICL